MTPNTFRIMSAFVAAASIIDLTLLKKTPTKYGPARKASGYIGLAGAAGLLAYAEHLEKKEKAEKSKELT